MDLGLDTAARWRLAGLVLGITAGFTTLTLFPFTAAGPVLAVPVFAVVVGLGVLAGEVTLPRPERGPATAAALEVRHVRDYLPRPAANGVGLLAGGLAVLALLGVSATYTPWGYGPFGGQATVAGLIAVGTVAAVVGVAWLVLVQVARSPRTGIDGEDLRRDDAWRRRTAYTVTAACGVVVSGTLAGSLLVGAGLVARYQPLNLISIAAALVGSVALVAFGVYTAMLLRPAVPARVAAAETEPASAPVAL